MTTDNTTLSVREAIHQGGGAAEKQLVLIGKEGGDHQIALVVSELSPEEIIVMSGDYDMTKSSLVSAFLSAGQFLEILGLKTREWAAKYASMTQDELSHERGRLQKEIEDFICPIVYSADEQSRFFEMLAVLATSDHGPDLIFLSVVGQKDFVSLAKTPNEAMVVHGTALGLMVDLASHHASEFWGMVDFCKKQDESLDDEENAIIHGLIQKIAEGVIPDHEESDEFIKF